MKTIYINYIPNTQLMIIRCLHNILKHSNFDSLIIDSIFTEDQNELNLFETIKSIDSRIKIINEPSHSKAKGIEHHQSRYLPKLLKNGIEDIVYMHVDTFLNNDFITKLFESGRSGKYMFAGHMKTNHYPNKTKYHANSCIFYTNLKIQNEYADISDFKNWMCRQFEENKQKIHTDNGYGSYAYHATINNLIYSIDNIYDIVNHYGEGGYQYHWKNKLKPKILEFKESLDWFSNYCNIQQTNAWKDYQKNL